MKASLTKRLRLGALGVASALAVGGAVALPAAATAQEAAPTDGEAYKQLVSELLQDPIVQSVGLGANNTVVVTKLADDSDAAEAAQKSAEGNAGGALQAVSGYANIHIEDVEEPIKTTASTDIVGGAGYFTAAAGEQQGGTCSIGFPGFTPDGDPAVLTAGHCSSDGEFTDVFMTDPRDDEAGGGNPDGPITVTHELGQFAWSQFGATNNAPNVEDETSTDFAAIDVTNDQLGLHPQVTDWTTPDDLSQSSLTKVTHVDSVSDSSDDVGKPIARSGRTTGVTEGTVLQSKTYFRVADPDTGAARIVYGFVSDAEVIPGDSGGSVVSGDAAVGVVSGTTGEYSFLADLQRGLDVLESEVGPYSVMLDLQEPQITEPAEGGVVGAGATVRGTAAPNTTLQVAVRDGDVQAFPVDSEGNFEFPAPGEPGEYELQLRVKDDGYNVSDVVDATLTVVPATPVITSPNDGGKAVTELTEITGSADPGATVRLSGDVTAEVTADDQGNWTAETDLSYGNYTVEARQIVNGVASQTATVGFSVVPVIPQYTNVSNGQEFAAADAPNVITGTGVNGATVTLSIDGQVAGEATVEAEVWSIEVPEAFSGAAEGEVTAAALAAGNHQLVATQSINGAESRQNAISVSVVPEVQPAPPEPDQPDNGNGGGNGGGDELAVTGSDSALILPLAGAGAVVLLAGLTLLVIRMRNARQAE